MRITMCQRLLPIEMAVGRRESFDDRTIVRREDLLAGQPVGGLGREPARFVHRAQDRKTIDPAGLVVFRTVPRCAV